MMAAINRRTFCLSLAALPAACLLTGAVPIDAAAAFAEPPLSARPHVMWMWMGSNITRDGITRDLEAMRDGGIGGAIIMALADVCVPWAGKILGSATPEIVAFTDPWWAMLRHAAIEAQRLGIELILHNCPGYETSGGPWIPPELSMQELIWATLPVTGGRRLRVTLPRKQVDPHPNGLHPKVFIPELGRIGIPEVEARRSFYRDVALIAVPAQGLIDPDSVMDLSDRMTADGAIDWQAPPGEWLLYRFGHTTTGEMIQPAQYEALGLECDKLDGGAVQFHLDHVLGELKKHLGSLVGPVLTTLYFDSYETKQATWTPKMPAEFARRRGHAIAPWLPVFAGRTIGSEARTAVFLEAFQTTIRELFEQNYWAKSGEVIHSAGLRFGAEPYGGPWSIERATAPLDLISAEFWTSEKLRGPLYRPAHVEELSAVVQGRADSVLAAEAFTTTLVFARWTATPAWLKPIGDAAFCDGVNRLVLHHWALQPWDDRYKPGMTMGRWGVQFGRNQTWWEPGKAWLQYLWRCQTLLQRGMRVRDEKATAPFIDPLGDPTDLRTIHRRDGETDLHFFANIDPHREVVAEIAFVGAGRQPECWDAASGATRDLAFVTVNGRTRVRLSLASAESCFVVFRRPATAPCTTFPREPVLRPFATLRRPWTLRFDPRWGGPAATTFDELQDWTERKEPGIRFYSGTVRYETRFPVPPERIGARLYLDLGTVHDMAEVEVNGVSLGVVWTAPWRVDISEVARAGDNRLAIAVTNSWANRLIGDEHAPADIEWGEVDSQYRSGRQLTRLPDWLLRGKPRSSVERRTFTTWNFFDASSPLEPAGLIGPVRLLS